MLSGGIFFGYIDTTYTKIKDLQQEKTLYNDALDNATRASETFATLQGKYNSIPQSEVEQIKRFLPDNIDNIRLVIDINNIALRHGMAIKGVKVDSSAPAGSKNTPAAGSLGVAVDEGGIGTVGVGFSVTGTYDNFLSFLKDLEKSMRLVDITAISVTAPTPGKTTSDYGVSVKTYWLK